MRQPDSVWNVLVVDDLHPLFGESLPQADFNLIYKPDVQAEAIASMLTDVHVLVVRSKVYINEELCRNANKLKLVARAGSGVDNLDTEWLHRNHISWVNTPEANSQAVAEQTLGMLLSLMANISKGDREVRQGIWGREANRGDELQGKTIGIIGYGHTGSRFAHLLRGFEVEILAYDKYKHGFGNNEVREVEMSEIFKHADIVSLHIPLTPETEYLITREYINLFEKNIRLLNLSRGAIVKTDDVLDALDRGKVLGFAADVLENERINQLNTREQKDFDRLCKHPNVVLTPHIGGWTYQSYAQISGWLALKISEHHRLLHPPEKGFTQAQKFP